MQLKKVLLALSLLAILVLVFATMYEGYGQIEVATKSLYENSINGDAIAHVKSLYEGQPIG